MYAPDPARIEAAELKAAKQELLAAKKLTSRRGPTMSNSPAVEICPSCPPLRRARSDPRPDRCSIAEREIFAILGPNGSGKTTLFRVLSTLIPLQQGEVQILGLDLRREACCHPVATRRRFPVAEHR